MSKKSATTIPDITPGKPRLIHLQGGETIEDIRRISTTPDGIAPDVFLVWRKDGFWDCYAAPGQQIQQAPNNLPIPPLDPRSQPKLPDFTQWKVESVVAITGSPSCVCLNGVWYWT